MAHPAFTNLGRISMTTAELSVATETMSHKVKNIYLFKSFSSLGQVAYSWNPSYLATQKFPNP
jgi:hypothetical protein